MNGRLLTATAAFVILPTLVASLRIERRDAISLYDAKSHVVELTDDTLTSVIYSSPKIWVVEFYAHWCGHCQKFAKVWKKIADEFQGKGKC